MIVPSAEQIERARQATHQLRDAAREGRIIEFRQRDPLVVAIHDIIDAAEESKALLDTLSQELDRLKHENTALLTRSGKPDAERDFSIHAPTDGGEV